MDQKQFEKDIQAADTLEQFKFQLLRVASHWESEQTTRAERNEGFDKQIKENREEASTRIYNNREEMFKRYGELDRKYHDLIFGDGTENKPGYDKRLDRVEQIVRSVKFLWGFTVGTMSGIIVGVIVYLITNHAK